MKIKKGDEVIITKGKDRGKKGKVEKVLHNKNSIVLLGLNIFKRHLKKKDEKNPGGIVEFARPLRVENIALICPKCTKPTRVGYKISGSNKIRICRKCKATV